MEQMEVVPCNRAYVAKLKEIEFWLLITYQHVPIWLVLNLLGRASTYIS